MPQTRATEHVAELRQIPLDRIQVPSRPARRFLGDIASLAASMQDYGLQQPVSVRADGDTYIVTSGMRRLTAARMLGWDSISAFVRSVNADDAYLVDLVENLQRQDLSPEEEADALGELIRTRGWTLEQVAEAVKRSAGYVSKRVRLFEDAELRNAVVNRGLPVSTAELLLATPAQHRSTVIERAIAEQWDQSRTRDELQSMDARLVELIQTQAGTSGMRTQGAAGSRRGVPAPSPVIERPPGFTRMIREFYRTIMAIRAEDLTSADRSALRAVFKGLVFLARAQTAPTQTVFPPLPSPSVSPRGRTRRSTTATKR